MWSNKQAYEGFVKERLDRVLANLLWKNMFTEVGVECLTTKCSNHKPVLFSISY